MVRNGLLFFSLLSTPFLFANLISATWGTSPAAPIYVAQEYDLTLTLETLQNEEISNVRLTQGPGRAPDRQTVYEKDGHRYTVLSWQQSENTAKLAAIPAGRLVADVTMVQVFGFMRSANTTRQSLSIAPFSYDVENLPGEASGVPVGTFQLSLSVDKLGFRPGEVRVLTATLTAVEGRIPESVSIDLEPTDAGETYPFRWVKRNNRQWIAEAYFVTSSEDDITLCLKPFKAFDLATRTLTTIQCEPVTLSVLYEQDETIEDTTLILDTTNSEKSRKQLYFSPTNEAPIIGSLESEWRIVTTYGDWIYVEADSISGWIRKRDLEDASL
ncbi:MAG: hypothetical protein IJV69_00685 [Kiritimatiellae bacterium]|nr:hypothetical protein [Kiritimatiellia bacterium]